MDLQSKLDVPAPRELSQQDEPPILNEMCDIHNPKNDEGELSMKPEVDIPTKAQHPEPPKDMVSGADQRVEQVEAVETNGIQVMKTVEEIGRVEDGKTLEDLKNAASSEHLPEDREAAVDDERERGMDGGEGSINNQTATPAKPATPSFSANLSSSCQTFDSKDEAGKVGVDDSPEEPESQVHQSQNVDQDGNIEDGSESEKVEESNAGEENMKVDDHVEIERESEEDGDHKSVANYQQPSVETQPSTPERNKHDEPQSTLLASVKINKRFDDDEESDGEPMPFPSRPFRSRMEERKKANDASEDKVGQFVSRKKAVHETGEQGKGCGKNTNDSSHEASKLSDTSLEVGCTASDVLGTSSKDQSFLGKTGNTEVPTGQHQEVIRPFEPPPNLPLNMDNLPFILDAWMRDIDSYMRAMHENLEKLRKKCQRCSCNDPVTELVLEKTSGAGDAPGDEIGNLKAGWDTIGFTDAQIQDNWGHANLGDTWKYPDAPEPRTAEQESEQERIALEESARMMAMEKERKCQDNSRPARDDDEPKCLECPIHCPPHRDPIPGDEAKPGAGEHDGTPDPDMKQKRIERFTPKPLSQRTIAARRRLEQQGQMNNRESRNRLGSSSRPPLHTTSAHGALATEQQSPSNYIARQDTCVNTQVAISHGNVEASLEKEPAAELTTADESACRPIEVVEKDKDEDISALVASDHETPAANSASESPPPQKAEGQAKEEARRRAREEEIAGKVQWARERMEKDKRVKLKDVIQHWQEGLRKVDEEVIEGALKVLQSGG